jgi:hypothetical protein
VSLSLESLHIAEHSGCSGRGFAGRGLLRKSSERVEGALGERGGITRSSPSSERDGRTGGAIRL